MLLFLAFIFPLGIYCLILGMLNRGERPRLVSGRWDFAGILFAASGFLLFVGPAVLTSVHERWRYYWLLGNPGSGEGPSGISYYLWILLWLLYYVFVLGVAAWMLKRRGGTTAVYNVDQAVLEVALARVLERLGVTWNRTGNHFFLNLVNTLLGQPPAEIELESFSAMNHATLRWQGIDEATRQAVEMELDRVMEGMPATQSSLAGWFLSLGLSILFVVLAGVVFVIVVNIRLLRG